MLIKKGAEANLYLEERFGRRVIIKRRLAKKYRIPELDNELRTYRTIHEAQIIHRAKEAGVPTPIILLIDISRKEIVMEYIHGRRIKEVLEEASSKERENICREIGRLIGKLHSNGIIHGDLTTSNMILTSDNRIVLIDFGLSEQTKELEARGVDLHLMRRCLQSSHYSHAEEAFEAIMKGYSEIVGEKETLNVLDKIKDIEKRGRYISGR